MRLQRLHTTEIVIVEEVDYTTWTCSVRPKARIDVQGTIMDMPVISGVPMSAPKAGDSVILMPAEIGDICLCVFSKHAIDNMLLDHATNSITIPREFDINDCILVSGLYTQMETVPTVLKGEILIKNQSGSHLKFFANGDMEMKEHTSGAYMKFSTDGNIEIKATRVDINEL